jgi:16S rRNA (uracil1498-N3)-methyltransferase
MSDAWFYMPQIPPASSEIELDDAEARHAIRSRRLQPGDRITLFNGQGLAAGAELINGSAGTRRATVRIVDHIMTPRPRPMVELACALPKGERQAVLLGMATQLGMHAFRPLVTQRAIARPTAAFHDRFTRICIEACKQCRRAYLPELREPAIPGELAREAVSARGTVLMAHPGGELLTPLATMNGDGVSLLTVMIGPEGGFTNTEINVVKQAGGMIARLGEHPLRIEAAAIAALALIMLGPMSSHVR